MSVSDRSLTNAFREITNMASKINLPKSIVVRMCVCNRNDIIMITPLQDRCKILYKQVYQEKQLRGRANDAVAAACLFIACRQEDVPRSFKEICAVSRHPKKEIGRCFKLIRLATKTEVKAVTTSDFMVGGRGGEGGGGGGGRKFTSEYTVFH